ncbi:RHS repeat-associated core domain-containing protein [Pseudomonas juntendi]|uniref:RHS repeat-associated core domain-containing protein n=1 Tax=Pseudomonas juntendi TaxID=2666183 RepID=A0A7W2KEP3_9PSED|nr:RHS repeat-associated core domain-containing protein [Pseudomonas juntendi]MBA6097012.1 RHS repeat-associated core domain-containing protein [Pseudomonas juntendi]
MTVQSNAFNFMSFTQGSVDPRTGTYALTIDLPALNANDLQGPDLPLCLAFNPMNGLNTGFGKGWSLKLSRFDPRDGMLELYTGESFQVIDNGPDAPALIPERKLESFHFQNIGSDDNKRYRVAHASGLVEILEVQQGPAGVALPVHVHTPSGHGISLEYDAMARLVSIEDDNEQRLLAIDYAGNAQVKLDLHPASIAFARYTLKFTGENLSSLVLPSEDQASWHFGYTLLGGLLLLERLDNPAGGTELITYQERGHALPGVDAWLPYVRRHVTQPDPLDEATHLRTDYTFTAHNYLGFGADGVVWDENYRQDHLYKHTGTQYTYGSTATHYCDGQPLRTEQRVFNRFHLMTEKVDTQEGCIETVKTEFHEVANARFEQQPAFFQLPHKITRSWSQSGNSIDLREETVTTCYDEHGNLVEELLASGIRQVREYYPASASDGCPEDPEGFVRNLKSITVYPAAVDDEGSAAAAILRTRYRYKAHAPLHKIAGSHAASTWLAAYEEQSVEVRPSQNNLAGDEEVLLRTIETAYLQMPDKPRLHGRVDYKKVSLNGTTARTEWAYEPLRDAQGKLTRLQTKTHFKAPGGTLEKIISHVHCGLTGQLLEGEDVNGIITRFQYDVLGRLVEHTINPDDSIYRTTTTYAYPILREDNRTRRAEEVTDAKGVVTRVVHDGNQRRIREEREITDPETQQRITRTTAEYRYDSIGRLVSETAFDYVIDDPDGEAPTERTLTMTSGYTYDGWGGLRTKTRPDKTCEHRVFSPFGKEGNVITRWVAPADEPGAVKQLGVVEFNRFGNPAHEYRQMASSPTASATDKAPQREVGRVDYRYDGLGRCVRRSLTLQAQTQAPIIRADAYHYDIWGRIDESTRADGSSLLRSFAPHSTRELTTLLAIRKQAGASPQQLCKRTFDGLDRLRETQVGQRVDTYDYRGQTQLIETRTTRDSQATSANARKRTITYQYTPELSTEPQRLSASFEQDGRTQAVNEATFDYDPLTADISGAENDLGARSYDYTDQGYLKTESWKGQRQHDTHNRFSVQGRMTYRKHSDGTACLYQHDELGRIVGIKQGDLQCTLTYNGLGQLEETLTCDTAKQGHYVKCTQTYDELGRELTRALDSHGQVEQVLTLKWRDDDRLETRTLTRNGAQVRHETFGYDEIGRLESHDCEGSELPRDAAGRAIVSQLFRFDEHDNITRRVTDYDDGESERLDFIYTATDPFRLQSVVPDRDDSRERRFAYDELGNMLNDEQGRQLEYDSLGRLAKVMAADGQSPITEYQYDGHDQLLAAVHDGNRSVERRYQDNRLDATLEGDTLTQYLYAGTGPVAEQQSGKGGSTTLMLTDHTGSVITESDDQSTRHGNYSVYGERAEDSELSSLLAFNGEAREQAYGWYLLGSGYRAYNPALMRFHSPDSLAQEESGINPYVYTLADPVNWRDPSGHRAQSVLADRDPPKYRDPIEQPGFSWLEIIPVAMKVLMTAALVGMAVYTGGLSVMQMFAAGGMVAAIATEGAGVVISATGGSESLVNALKMGADSVYQLLTFMFFMGGKGDGAGPTKGPAASSKSVSTSTSDLVNSTSSKPATAITRRHSIANIPFNGNRSASASSGSRLSRQNSNSSLDSPALGVPAHGGGEPMLGQASVNNVSGSVNSLSSSSSTSSASSSRTSLASDPDAGVRPRLAETQAPKPAAAGGLMDLTLLGGAYEVPIEIQLRQGRTFKH